MRRKCIFLLIILFACLTPGLAQQQPFQFILLTDTQLGMAARDKNFLQESANFEFAVATVNRLKPAFVVVLGDLVNKTGDAEQIREYRRISNKIDPSIPVYNVAGNHDVGHVPTPENLAAYRKNIGRDYYSFRNGPVYGIVLNSSLILDPKNVMADYQEQEDWLKKELETAKASGAPHIIVFQHHPYFIKEAQEPDDRWNIPLERRKTYVELFYKYGVRNVFAGHTHMNYDGKDGELEVVANAPVGISFGDDGSGIRVVTIVNSTLTHQYFDFGRIPNQLGPQRKF
jgi:3',5'-cyclic AMP phosphodiesterase CpdA